MLRFGSTYRTASLAIGVLTVSTCTFSPSHTTRTFSSDFHFRRFFVLDRLIVVKVDDVSRRLPSRLLLFSALRRRPLRRRRPSRVFLVLVAPRARDPSLCPVVKSVKSVKMRRTSGALRRVLAY